MAQISIDDNHKRMLTRAQDVLEWLQGEQARLQAELAHVAAQGQRAESELRSFLLHTYGVAPGSGFTLDVDAGTIETPDEPEQPQVQPQPDKDTAAPDGD